MSEIVQILIGDKELRYTEMSLTTAVDAIPLAEYSAPFDPLEPTLREMFRPFRFPEVSVLVNGEREFTGTQNVVNPQLTPQAAEVAAGAYSLPGVLADCSPDPAGLPYDFRNATLKEITDKLIAPFGLRAEIPTASNTKFKKIKIDPDSGILGTLVDLARQAGLVIAANALGDLVFQHAQELSSPVASLSEGQRPLLGITPTFRPEEVYSEVTGIRAVRVRTKESNKFTVFPYLTEAFRPYVFEVDKADDATKATNAAGARMAAGAVSYTVELPTWRDEAGNLWRPDTTVRLYAPSVFIYRAFDFLVRTVKLSKNATEEHAALELTLPGSFLETVQREGAPWED